MIPGAGHLRKDTKYHETGNEIGKNGNAILVLESGAKLRSRINGNKSTKGENRLIERCWISITMSARGLISVLLYYIGAALEQTQLYWGRGASHWHRLVPSHTGITKAA